MTLTTYFTGTYDGCIPEEMAEEAFYYASRHIDSLTLNRIIERGYDNLTEFQKAILSDVCKKQAEFEYENSSVIDTILSSYSINGVSMGIDANGWNVFVQNGVVMQKSLYELLKQTGLTCRSLGV